MGLLGHLIALLGLYSLYVGEIVFGSIVFLVGGFLASKLFFCFRSGGVMLMVVTISYGYHNEYTPTVLFLIFVGFVFACFSTRQASIIHDNSWGFDIDFSSSGSGSGSGSDSGGGGDCGGGGD